MVISASVRKSLTDLSRRRARTVFTVFTLALAVASVSFFAIPTLIDRAMQEEVRAGHLADVTLTMRPLELTAADLAALEALPNVAAVEPRASVEARVLVGERRAPARVIGVRDFARQHVDLVRVESGALPGRGEVLADIQNANTGVHAADAGDTVVLVGAGGAAARAPAERVELRVSGRGRSLPGGEQVQDEGVVVLYADAATVQGLSGEPGYGWLSLRLTDPSPAAAAATVEAARRRLATVAGFTGFSNLPAVRAPGDWPGREDTEKFAQLLGAITVVALLSAIVLISNTMTTLVGEQTREIGIMRALGARRRQVASIYVRTALLLGAIGAVAGVAMGTLLSSLLARSFGQMFWAIDVGFGVDLPVVAAGLLVGLLAPPLAALPAIRRGVRVDLREALESSGSALGAEGAGDRLLRRAAFLPRTVQIGLRGVGRRKRRSVATALIVALAVGNMLAFLSMAAGAGESTRTAWGDHLEDVRVWTSGRTLFDEHAERAIRATPGVAEAQPALVNTVELDGRQAFVWGVQQEPLFRYRMATGRWFSASEEQAREPVAVIERNLARAAGIEVGETVALATAAGDARLRIIGIADNQQENGTVLFVPLTTLRALLGASEGASTYWIRTESPEHAFVDRTTTRLEDSLGALGYDVAAEITYVAERDEIAANRTLTTSITLLGFLIVAMSMVGLANAITMNVLERTREIGILRCLGARGKDVRRIFTTEGLVLAFAGWLAGIPLGYAVNLALVRLVRELINVDLPVVFPLANVPLALGGALLLALVVLFLPVRRAVRFRPGDAIRYA